MAREITLDQFERELMNMVESWENGSHLPLTSKLREPIARGFSLIFNSRVDSRGSAWPEHAPSTVAQYGPHPLLRLSNTMYQSLTTSSGDSHYELLTDHSVSWGTSVFYAFAQNYGYDHIPAREFCYWSDGMIKESMQMVGIYVDYRYLREMTRE